jgi:glycosyltransferase involved in cell wall biosynthesis
MILKGLTQSQHVVCVSKSTRTDLLRLSGISEQRVSCVYNSLTYPYLPMHEFEAVRRLRNLRLDPNRPFLLHVGGNQWYKNRLGVLQTFSRLRNLTGRQTLRLVMVGKPWTTEMRQFVLENSMTDLTTELVAVADEDLRALYSTATMMLFPSLHEGFGWPIIEAQACGCPVATSKRPPMDEIAGRAAIYIDPENADSAAAILHQSLAGVSDLRESSIANAARFRSGMIEGYLSLYEKLCREKTLSSAGVLDKLTTGSSVWSAGGLQ